MNNDLARLPDLSSLAWATEAERVEGANDTSDEEVGTSARFGRLDMVRSLFDLGKNGLAKFDSALDSFVGERCDVGESIFSGELSTRISPPGGGAGGECVSIEDDPSISRDSKTLDYPGMSLQNANLLFDCRLPFQWGLVVAPSLVKML